MVECNIHGLPQKEGRDSNQRGRAKKQKWDHLRELEKSKKRAGRERRGHDKPKLSKTIAKDRRRGKKNKHIGHRYPLVSRARVYQTHFAGKGKERGGRKKKDNVKTPNSRWSQTRRKVALKITCPEGAGREEDTWNRGKGSEGQKVNQSQSYMSKEKNGGAESIGVPGRRELKKTLRFDSIQKRPSKGKKRKKNR